MLRQNLQHPGYVLCFIAHLYPTLCDPMDCSPPGSSVHRDSPGKNTGVDCHALLQWIFPVQGLNPGLSHYRQRFFTGSFSLLSVTWNKCILSFLWQFLMCLARTTSTTCCSSKMIPIPSTFSTCNTIKLFNISLLIVFQLTVTLNWYSELLTIFPPYF